MLKVCAGVALIVVAFKEKLATPDMALHFLRENPEFNVAQQIGLQWSDLEFTRVAGAIEVLFGLLLISGALSQACVLLAGIPFNATLWFFGTDGAGRPPARLRRDARAPRLRLRPGAAPVGQRAVALRGPAGRTRARRAGPA